MTPLADAARALLYAWDSHDDPITFEEPMEALRAALDAPPNPSADLPLCGCTGECLTVLTGVRQKYVTCRREASTATERHLTLDEQRVMKRALQESAKPVEATERFDTWAEKNVDASTAELREEIARLEGRRTKEGGLWRKAGYGDGFAAAMAQMTHECDRIMGTFPAYEAHGLYNPADAKTVWDTACLRLRATVCALSPRPGIQTEETP